MTHFVILESITILLAFLVNIGIFYLLIKLFDRSVKFLAVLKLILLYEAGFFAFWIVDPFRFLYSLLLELRVVLYPLYFIVPVVILFLFLYFLMRKFSLLNLKKTLVIFLIMFFMVTPFISYSRTMLTHSIIDLELSILYEMIEIFTFQGLSSPAKTIKIINTIDDSLLGGKFFRELRRFIITR